MADTTQPAGALPEPWEKATAVRLKYLPKELPEPAIRADFIEYDEDYYSTDTVRALMAERDAAREQSIRLRGELATERRLRDALRRELEELSEQEPISWITSESLRSLTARGGNESRGTVPMHACQSTAAKIPLYARPIPKE